MGKDKLDKVVKDKLYDLHTPIDTNDLWQGIQMKMGSEDEAPIAGFSFRKYLGLGILAILVMSSLYLIQDSTFATSQSNVDSNISEVSAADKTSDASANIDSDNRKDLNSNMPSEVNHSATVLNNEISSSSNTIESKEINTTKSKLNSTNNKSENGSITSPPASSTTNASVSNAKASIAKATTISASTKNTTATSPTSSESLDKQRKTDNNLNGTIQTVFSQQTSSDERTEKSQNAAAGSAINSADGGKGSNNIYESALNENNSNSLPILTQESAELAQKTSLNAKASNNQINTLVALELLGELKNKNNPIDVCDRIKSEACTGQIFNFRNRVDCYDNWTGDRSKFSILPYIGLDLVANDGSRTDSASDEYLGVRENTMRFLEVIKAGALIKYNVTQNFYVKVGAEYNLINEKFESTVVTTDQQLNPDAIIAYRINMEGDTIPVIGPGFTTVISTTKWKKYNKYHSFNVPVILGYEAPLSKRWDYFAEGGIFYNVKFSYVGKLLNTENEVVSGTNFYRNQTGVSLYGGAGARFNIDKRWSVFTAGSYKYNLSPINNQDFNPIKQNFGLAGIAIGAEIRF